MNLRGFILVTYPDFWNMWTHVAPYVVGVIHLKSNVYIV